MAKGGGRQPFPCKKKASSGDTVQDMFPVWGSSLHMSFSSEVLGGSRGCWRERFSENAVRRNKNRFMLTKKSKIPNLALPGQNSASLTLR